MSYHTLLNIFIIFQQNCILLNSILRDEIFSQKPIEYGYEITDLLAWLAASLLPTFRYRCDCCVFFPHYSADWFGAGSPENCAVSSLHCHSGLFSLGSSSYLVPVESRDPRPCPWEAWEACPQKSHWSWSPSVSNCPCLVNFVLTLTLIVVLVFQL